MPEIRSAFDKQKDIEYSITSISGKDLDITKENDKVVVRFAYEKEIELIDPVYLLIKYEGRSQLGHARCPASIVAWTRASTPCSSASATASPTRRC